MARQAGSDYGLLQASGPPCDPLSSEDPLVLSCSWHHQSLPPSSQAPLKPLLLPTRLLSPPPRPDSRPPGPLSCH